MDTLHGKHANQHIPQITGALETYKGTHNPDYYRVAENFWSICTNAYMYSIGGVAGASTPKNAECFTAEPNTLFVNGFAKGGQNETCATYNLLKLSRQLFMFESDGKYMDYYEQALYNHILGSVAENSPGNTYHVPLNPGCQKHFGNAKHGRVYLLQWDSSREQHEAARFDLLPRYRQPRFVCQLVRAFDGNLGGASCGGPATDPFSLRRYGPARHFGPPAVCWSGRL